MQKMKETTVVRWGRVSSRGKQRERQLQASRKMLEASDDAAL